MKKYYKTFIVIGFIILSFSTLVYYYLYGVIGAAIGATILVPYTWLVFFCK